MLPIELGWSMDGRTGWGIFAQHLALGLARQGRRVHADVADSNGIPKTLWPQLWPMGAPADTSERRIRFDPYGNHAPKFVEIPNRYRVLLAVFEDTDAIDVEQMSKYDLILSPSRWVQDLLAAKGLESTLFHQGFDDSLFFPAPKRRSDDRFMIFSGGKLEFRKGQDIVVEAFRQFLATPEGANAILVTAWQNAWPQTMAGIWESGYVKGVPEKKGNQLDISSWLEINGIPRGNHIDLGWLSQAEMANAMRECDVGLFPNRCEGATNLAYVEALALGLPCISSLNTGQEDVQPRQFFNCVLQPPVTLPCALYRGMDGWGETDPKECADHLAYLVTRRGTFSKDMSDWTWRARTDDLHQLLTERADG